MPQYHVDDMAERQLATRDSYFERHKDGYKEKKVRIFEIYRVF